MKLLVLSLTYCCGSTALTKWMFSYWYLVAGIDILAKFYSSGLYCDLLKRAYSYIG